MKIKVVSSGKATGQLQHIGRQKQGWNPLLPDAKELFSLREVVLRENNCVRFGRYASLSACVLFAGGCVVRISNLFHKDNQSANWKVSKKCDCSRENLLQNNLLRKCGLLAHTSAAFLKNCCTEKLSVACGLLLGNDVSRETDF